MEIKPYSEKTDRKIVELLDNPCTSHWLRDALLAALQRDPVDSLLDSEHLKQLLKERNDEITNYFKTKFVERAENVLAGTDKRDYFNS